MVKGEEEQEADEEDERIKVAANMEAGGSHPRLRRIRRADLNETEGVMTDERPLGEKRCTMSPKREKRKSLGGTRKAERSAGSVEGAGEVKEGGSTANRRGKASGGRKAPAARGGRKAPTERATPRRRTEESARGTKRREEEST